MIRIGIIGAGTMGGCHLGCYEDIPGVKVVAVCDLIKEKAENLASNHGARVVTDAMEIINAEDIDYVDICLPTPLHYVYAIPAMKNKKHVFCEKPIARTIDEADEMVKTAKENSVKFTVGHVLRFFPEYVKLKDKMEKGLVGTVKEVRTARESSNPGMVCSWYGDIKQSGGPMFDMALHDVDYLIHTFGDVEYVKAIGKLGEEKYPLFDYAYTLLKFKNGMVAHATGSWALPKGAPFTTKIEVYGTEGMMEESILKTSPIISYISKESKETGTVAVPESPMRKTDNPYFIELKHFVDSINKDTEPLVTGESALKTLRVAVAIEKSLLTHKKQFVSQEG